MRVRLLNNNGRRTIEGGLFIKDILDAHPEVEKHLESHQFGVGLEESFRWLILSEPSQQLRDELQRTGYEYTEETIRSINERIESTL